MVWKNYKRVIVLIGIDTHVLGSIDFIKYKIYGILFAVINACLMLIIQYCKKSRNKLQIWGDLNEDVY